MAMSTSLALATAGSRMNVEYPAKRGVTPKSTVSYRSVAIPCLSSRLTLQVQGQEHSLGRLKLNLDVLGGPES